MLSDIPYSDIMKYPGMTRWHMVRVKRPQTLAEHVAMVAMIASKMVYSYAPHLLSHISEVYEYALIHDTHEIKFGDLPTPVKKANDSDIDDMFSKMYWENLGVSPPDPLPEVKAIVKLADMIEAIMYYAIEGYDELQDGIGIKDTLTLDLMKQALYMKEEFKQEWPTFVLEVLDQMSPKRNVAPQQEDKEDSPSSEDIPLDTHASPV